MGCGETEIGEGREGKGGQTEVGGDWEGRNGKGGEKEVETGEGGETQVWGEGEGKEVKQGEGWEKDRNEGKMCKGTVEKKREQQERERVRGEQNATKK